MSCLEPRILDVILYEGTPGLAAAVSTTQTLFIKSGSPLVWMHVAIYFRGVPGDGVITVAATDDVDLYSYVQDPIQGALTLDSIVTGSQLPFTWEGTTAADGLKAVVTQGEMDAQGNIVARVTFYPAQPMDECTWQELSKRCGAWANPVVRQLVSG